jgi:hypothetical protein
MGKGGWRFPAMLQYVSYTANKLKIFKNHPSFNSYLNFSHYFACRALFRQESEGREQNLLSPLKPIW